MEEYWSGHRERLRLRAESEGIDALRDYEVLELVLCYAMPRQDMNQIARNLINHFGSVKNVFNATRAELMKVNGVGRVMADWLLLTGELIHAYAAIDPEEQPQIVRYRDTLDYLTPRRMSVVPPECWMIYTDFDNRLLMHAVICDSLSWAEPEYVCQCMMDALALQARHAILVLFVGALPLEFEDYDVNNLLHFSRAMRGIDVELLDCVLVGESGYCSMNAEGRMDNIRRESLDLSLHERYAGDAPETPSGKEE